MNKGFHLGRRTKIKRKYLRAKLWPSWYDYYSKELTNDDILIKADDDVVFIYNLGSLVDFIRSRRADDLAVVFPNIINNEVGAYWQLQEDMLPQPTSLYPVMKTLEGYENMVACEPV